MNRLQNVATRLSTARQFTSVRPSLRQTGRLLAEIQKSNLHSFTSSSLRSPIYTCLSPLRSKFMPNDIRIAGSSRSFHYGSRLGQDKETKAQGDPPKEGAAEEEAAKKA